MIRCIGRIAAFVAFVALSCAAARAAAPFGALFVTSLPSAADVWVDGSYIGRTPLLIDGLRAGKHSVTVTKAGWKVSELDQEVNAGATAGLTVQLQPGTHDLGGEGAIALHGLRAAATVSVDGQSEPLLGLYRVSAGVHHISVRTSGTRYDRTVAVYPSQTTHVLFRPAAADEHSAVVAPASAYLPPSAYKVAGTRLVIKWSGHVVVGHLGDAKFFVDHRDVTYDAPAGLVRGKLFLPLDLILMLTGKVK